MDRARFSPRGTQYFDSPGHLEHTTEISDFNTFPRCQGSEVGSQPEMYPHSIAEIVDISLEISTLSEAIFSEILAARLDFGMVIQPRSWQNLMAT